MTSLVYKFADQNILIKSVGPHQYTFSFDGTEEQFVSALRKVMEVHGYQKQDEHWFPGDPCEEGNDAYYIESTDYWDNETFMSFNWNTKEVNIS